MLKWSRTRSYSQDQEECIENKPSQGSQSLRAKTKTKHRQVWAKTRGLLGTELPKLIASARLVAGATVSADLLASALDFVPETAVAGLCYSRKSDKSLEPPTVWNWTFERDWFFFAPLIVYGPGLAKLPIPKRRKSRFDSIWLGKGAKCWLGQCYVNCNAS